MKTKVFNLFVLLALGLSAITSCTSDFESEVEFYLNPENIELESQRGSMATFTISTDGEWTVTNVPSFVKVSSTKGKGTTIITVQTVAENNTSRDYEDIIVVSVDGAKETKSITIKQSRGIEPDCFTEPANILLMSDGLAFNWQHGKNTHYYYWGIFSLEDYNKLNEAEIIEKVATGNVDDRVTPDQDNYACFYNLNAKTQYMVVTISYATNGKRGEVVITPLTTKSSSSQPVAVVESVSYATDSNNNYYYAWDVEKNTYCNQYYTYAAASKDYFKTYYWLEEGAIAILAWAIREEILSDAESHNTRINSFSDGRETFIGAQVNNGTSYLAANVYTDTYFQVVTWGTDSRDELSGKLGGGIVDLSEDSSETSKARVKPLNANTHSSEGPKKVLVNRNYIEIFRIK